MSKSWLKPHTENKSDLALHDTDMTHRFFFFWTHNPHSTHSSSRAHTMHDFSPPFPQCCVYSVRSLLCESVLSVLKMVSRDWWIQRVSDLLQILRFGLFLQSVLFLGVLLQHLVSLFYLNLFSAGHTFARCIIKPNVECVNFTYSRVQECMCVCVLV